MGKLLKGLLTCVLCIGVLAGCGVHNRGDAETFGTLLPDAELVGLEETRLTAMLTDIIDENGLPDLGISAPEMTLESGYTMQADDDELVFDGAGSDKASSFSNETTAVTVSAAGYGGSDRTTTIAYTSNPIKIPELSSRLSVKGAGKAYWYKQLTEKERRIYKAIVKAVINFDSVAEFEDKLVPAEYEKIYGIVFYQNPELFWMSAQMSLDDDGMSAPLYYTYTKAQTAELQRFLDSKVSDLAKTIPANAAPLKKLQICHDYLCTHTTFAMSYATGETVIGGLIDGVAQCTGYAKSMLYLCNVIEVPCVFVVGRNSEGASHAWTLVQLNDEWYLVDPVWDDPILKVPDPQNVSYQYFCVPDACTRNITHFEANIALTNSHCSYFDLPLCNSEAQNIDAVYGNYARTYEEGYEILRKDMFSAVESGRTTAHVKFSAQAVYLDARKRLYDDKELFNIRREIEEQYGSIIKGLSVSTVNSLSYLQVTITY